VKSKIDDGFAFLSLDLLLFRGRLFRVTDCGGGPIEKGGRFTKIPSVCS
jgi:hypothetical protein